MEDKIFKAYLEDRCPLCDSDNLSLVSENIGAGKTLSSTFFCISCKSDYVVGFNRSFNPIQSEILIDNYNKESTVLNKKTHNTLLASKAPELLNFIQSFIQSFESDYVIDGEIVDNPYEWLIQYYKQAKELIKQATTL